MDRRRSRKNNMRKYRRHFIIRPGKVKKKNTYLSPRSAKTTREGIFLLLSCGSSNPSARLSPTTFIILTQ